MSTATADRFDVAIEIKNVSRMLTPTRTAHITSEHPEPLKMTTDEILAEVYTVVSLVTLIGVLLYQIAA